MPAAFEGKVTKEALAADPGLKGFIEKAHAAGFTQKQMDLAVSEYAANATGIGGAMAKITADECSATLKQTWKTDADYCKGVESAYRAASTYGDADKLIAKFGNDPDFIQLMAKVGRELGEDKAPGAGAAAMSEPDIVTLQASPAYWDAANPQHATVKAKVDAHYLAKYGDKPKAPGSTTAFQIS